MVSTDATGEWDREGIRQEYKDDDNMRAFMDKVATYVKNPRKTDVEWIRSNLAMSRKTAIEILRSLEEKGCGKFYVGRHTHRTRIEWSVQPIKVAEDARLAPGETGAPLHSRETSGVEYVEHQYRIRRDASATVRTPVDLTEEEAAKLAEHVRNSWFA